jgi:hypothetical protein
MNAVVALADGKASKVVRAICDGLLEADQRDDFVVDMDTFGEGDYGMCFGCAATCALMKLSQAQFTPKTVDSLRTRASVIGVSPPALSNFEHAVDVFRYGSDEAETLLALCNVPFEVVAEYCETHSWYLGNKNWREQLPALRQFADFLEANGY